MDTSPLVGCWTPYEVTLELAEPAPGNPFEHRIKAVLFTPTQQRTIDGFCDDPSGRIYRVRFMPTEPGPHTYEIDGKTGAFTARDEGNPGMLRPRGAHFEWSGTGEPFFWNSTTAYMLNGLSEPRAFEALDRLARYGINRVRVALCPSRQKDASRWCEPTVTERDDFTFRCAPWPAQNPESFDDPQYDTSRFEVETWQKLERIVDHARHLGIVVQIIFVMDAQEPQNYPFDRESLDDPRERAYYRYAIARLASRANIEWCIANEWALFRADEWVDAIGPFIAETDPYGHLLTVHGHGHFPFAGRDWCTHAQFQVWDEHGGHEWALKTRAAMPRPIPVVNEEFGYEDHYPYPWGEGRLAPCRNPQDRARIAWGLAMAGCWATTGEYSGDGVGGWINGLGTRDSELLRLHQHMRTFFESFEWWKCEPADELVSGYAFCLAEPGRQVAVYLPSGGCTSVTLPEGGRWTVESFDPITGARETLATDAELIRDPGMGAGYITPYQDWGRSWAFLIRRAESNSPD